MDHPFDERMMGRQETTRGIIRTCLQKRSGRNNRQAECGGISQQRKLQPMLQPFQTDHTVEEMETVIAELPRLKAPGIDGIPIELYKMLHRFFAPHLASAFNVRELALGVAKVIRRLVARFIWKPRAKDSEGFLSKVAMDTLCFPRHKGGLGLTDPTRRNQAQLCNWIIKIANMKTMEQWVAIAERILMGEWALSRPQDVWACFFIPSFRKRKLKSGFWEPIRRAWNRSPPDQQKSPATQEEVLNQLLFENPAIVDQSNQVLAADGSSGSFGQAWVRRGVVRISDLWSTLLGGWKPLDEVKPLLRGLQRVEEHWGRIISAIPQEWKVILGPEGLDPAGTWYIPKQEREEGTLWKVLEILPSGFRRIERWRCEGPANILSRVEEDTTLLWDNPAQARVLEVRGKKPSALISTWVGRLPLSQLCIDPSAWSWAPKPEDQASLGLGEYSVAAGYQRQLHKLKTPAQVDIPRWQAVWEEDLSNAAPKFEKLWEVLSTLPNGSTPASYGCCH
ncbi:hypothetical protein CBR_g46686 [Chara braunii]|uniref:Uncharacterized protein n=1 Tax=Chara braunii TaxID=69332 RepID=A0A388M0V5_CHABU|nr:hypothetical protein CBR_g46686 [Chara braunii]|eukprot:GBG88198.1 hypothetical protein CBR_g46686 [Chara braunii]